MTKFCIATVAYPEAKDTFSDFFCELNTEGATLAIAEQGQTNIRDYTSNFDHQIFDIPQELSIPAVRAALFTQLKANTQADYYVFIDIDDRLRHDALALHAQTLEHADFSYGDQVLFEKNFDTPTGKSLFEIITAPDQLSDPADLRHGNCVGLSALALTRKALTMLPYTLPDELIATDWYLAVKMLEAGLQGQKSGRVTDYCLTGSALRALETAQTVQDWLERTQAAYAHLAALSENKQLEKIIYFEEELQTHTEYILNLAKEVCPEKPMWYEDVNVLAAHLYKNKDERTLS